MHPMEARAKSFAEIRSPYKALLWLTNPIMLYNLRRARLGKKPYWKRWHSLFLIGKGKGWNSYALFVKGQDMPRIVIKKTIPVYTSYGIPTGVIWGIMYYNEPEDMFMNVYMENANFGKAFDFNHEKNFAYNNNPGMKKKIIEACISDLKKGRKLFWNMPLLDFYLKALKKLHSSISQ